MGLSLQQLAEITPFMFFEYKMPGFFDGKIDEEKILRKLAEINIMPHIKQNANFNINHYWRISGDSQELDKSVLTDGNRKIMIANTMRQRDERRKLKP